MKSLSEFANPKSILYAYFFLFLGAVAVSSFYHVPTAMENSDSKVYYVASKILTRGNIRKIYDAEYQKNANIAEINGTKSYMLFINTPVSILPFVPMSFFSYPYFYIVAVGMNTILVGLSVFILFKAVKLNRASAILLMFFVPLYSALFQGQLTGFILFFYVLCIAFLRKPFLSGIFAALLFIKVQHLLFVPFIFLLLNPSEDSSAGIHLGRLRIPDTKSIKMFLSGFVPVLFLLLLLNIFIYGPDVYSDYFKYMNSREDRIIQGEKYESYNIYSLGSVLNPKFGPEASPAILAGTLVLLYIAALYLLALGGQDVKYKISGAVFLALVLNIHTKYTDLLMLGIPFLLLSGNIIWERSCKTQTNLLNNLKNIVVSLIIILVSSFCIVGYHIFVSLLFLFCGFWLMIGKPVRKSPLA